MTYQWNFGDGFSTTGNPVTHTYSATGTYTVVVTASNRVSIVTATTMAPVVVIPVTGDYRLFLPLVLNNSETVPPLTGNSDQAYQPGVSLPRYGDASPT